MSEHALSPRQSLEDAIAEKFANMSNAQIIRRMEQAEDFGYDDEAVELNRRLKLGGLAWKWSGDFYRPKVEIYEPGGGEDGTRD